MSVRNRLVAEKVAWLVYSHPDLAKPGDVAVAMAIASFANSQCNAWPSNTTISKHAHVGHTFVSDSIKRLKAMGILDWVDRTAKSESNLYTIRALVDDRHVPTETAERRVRRENRERNESRHQERQIKEREEATDPAELVSMGAEGWLALGVRRFAG